MKIIQYKAHNMCVCVYLIKLTYLIKWEINKNNYLIYK